MSAARILVVEDDRTTADLVALYLRHAGFAVRVEHDGDEAARRLATERFGLVVLDVMLPGTDGLSLCRKIRSEGDTPIILLTARAQESQRIAGLELGADDYVTKPFSPGELVARVRAVLRRAPPSDVMDFGEVRIDRERREVRREGTTVHLTPSEYAILEALVERPGRPRSRAALLRNLPGDGAEPLERTIDVHVRNLRTKLEADPSSPRFIETVAGFGYRVADPSTGTAGSSRP